MIGDGAGKRPWVYISDARGLYKRIHRISGAILIVIFFVAPFIVINGNRLIFLDIPARRFHLFGAVFTAMDTRFLLLLLLFFGFAIGFATAVLGRMWCGYACPQTVFLERWFHTVERWIEGNRGARRKLDRGSWTAQKIRKKVTKWAIFLVMSAAISTAFVSFFTESALALWTARGSATAYGFVAFFTGALYFNFAWFREQFCNYLCPYARIQGAFADEHSLVIGYDTQRGEPRRIKGRRKKKKADTAGEREAVLDTDFGECVNCGRCVAVCPQGIDIRDGYQLECITCGFCIDACTPVMARTGAPSLINYTSEAKLKGQSTRLLRPRPVIFGATLVVLVALMGVLLGTRSAIDATVTRTPGELYTVLNDGQTQNAFQAHILNNDDKNRTFSVAIEGFDGANLVVPFPEFDIPGGGEMTLPVFVLAAPDVIAQRTTEFEIVIRSGNEEIRRPATFKSGVGEL